MRAPRETALRRRRERPARLAPLACAWLALACGGGEDIAVDVAPARETSLSVRVTTNGSVEPVDKAEVRARLDGRVVEITRPGTRVAEGGLLLRMDAGPVSSELAAAESELLATSESLRAARDRYRRVRERAATDTELYEQKAVTAERYRESQAELADARARVAFLEREVPLRSEALDLRIEELRARRDAAEIRAPFAGTVYRIAARRGQSVRVGEPVLWFADLERLRVRANVDQVDLGRVGVGQRVIVSSNAYPGRRWSGQIRELIPHVVVKESRSVAEALAEVEPKNGSGEPGGLVPGMTVDVEIVVDSAARALQVPAEAVFRDERGPFVYRLDGPRVRETRVRTGRTTVETIEILEGLSADDRVALGPVDGLRDGARVQARARDDG